MLRNFIFTAICTAFIMFLGFGTGIVVAPRVINSAFSSKIAKLTKKPTEIKLLFLGDIMMDRNIRTVSEKNGYDFFFGCAKPNFSDYDFVIANLEGPVTDYDSVSRVNSDKDPNLYRFTMSKDALYAMKSAGIDILNIDNNHIFDFGREGLEKTRKNLIKADLKYFGDPIDPEYRTLTLQKNNIVFHLIPYNEFSHIENDTKKILGDFSIKKGPKIVFTHWGDEYIDPPIRIKELARSFVNHGADLIIGTHPHVLLEVEEYNESTIFYSLGNFIFDQYWMESVRNGGAAEIVIKSNGEITSRLLKVSLDESRRPCISK